MSKGYVKKVLDEYFKIKDVHKALQFLVEKGIEAGREGNTYAASEIFGIGHSILKNSGVEPAKDIFVRVGTQGQFYCWECDRMVFGKGGTQGTLKCKACMKTFCPSHATATNNGKRCPFCSALI